MKKPGKKTKVVQLDGVRFVITRQATWQAFHEVDLSKGLAFSDSLQGILSGLHAQHVVRPHLLFKRDNPKSRRIQAHCERHQPAQPGPLGTARFSLVNPLRVSQHGDRPEGGQPWSHASDMVTRQRSIRPSFSPGENH